MTYIIPPQDTKRHSQTNLNDVTGTLHITKNINLDDEANIVLSHPAVAVMTTDDDSDFDDADAMFIGDGRLYVNADEVFSGDVDNATLSSHASDSNAPSPGTEDDVIYFNDVQVVSDGTTVKYKSGGSAWTTIGTTTISGVHPTALAVFDAQSGLMVGHGNEVDLINTSWGLDRTLTIPNVYKVSSMVAVGSVAYIATRHDAGGEARLFVWDGNATTASESYGIDAFEIASVKAYQSSVVCLTSDGRLLRFTGGGFQEIAVFPIYNKQYDWSNEINDYSTVSNRGMIVDGSLVYAIIASDITSRVVDYLPDFVGGVWCFDPAVGLYNRYTPSYTRITSSTNVSTGSVNTSTDTITVSSAPKTGTPFIYDPGGGAHLDPLRINRCYFVINVSSTEFQVALSEKDALAGTAVSLTSTGNAAQDFYFYETNDYGNTYTDNRQSIAVIGDTIRSDIYAGRVAFSSNLQAKQSTTDRTVLNTPSPLLPNRGYFVTPKMYSRGIEDKYNTVHIKYKTLKDDDKIVVKYRTKERESFPITVDLGQEDGANASQGTWSDTNTFTTTKDLSNVVAGDEIEIVRGVGAGCTFHVESISESSGTYTVNLDEEFVFAEASDVMVFVVDNWTKLDTITKDNKKSTLRLPKVGASEFIQFKIELRGIETTVRELQVLNQVHKNLQ